MANTSVHLPGDLLERLDREAARRSTSRNHLIVEACEQIVNSGRREWPKTYLAETRLTKAELRELHESFEDWIQELTMTRRNRKRAAF